MCVMYMELLLFLIVLYDFINNKVNPLNSILSGIICGFNMQNITFGILRINDYVERIFKTPLPGIKDSIAFQ